MTGRGIDQILPHPNEPWLYESYVRDARRYVQLAKEASGGFSTPVGFSYVWGDALKELEAAASDARIVNLETAVTQHSEPWSGKAIHYRMHPKNVPCLTAAGIDCCCLANNHVLDWGPVGLEETLDTLYEAGIATTGAGARLAQAAAPAVLTPRGENRVGRVLVFAYGSEIAGVPRGWQAKEFTPGVMLLPDLSTETVEAVAEQIWAARMDGDVVVFAVHWGLNWGYYVLPEQRRFAYQLIDMAGVDLVYGHSSHHVKGFEVYRDKLILYGCGDFLNDYEGIGGYERFRSELTLMYFPELDPASGELVSLRLVPMEMRGMQLRRAPSEDVRWLQRTLNRESRPAGVAVERELGGSLRVRW